MSRLRQEVGPEVRPLPDNDFRRTEVHGSFSALNVSKRHEVGRAIKDVLEGRSPVVVLRGFFSGGICKILGGNVEEVFEDKRSDGVFIPEMGPTHYNRGVEDYLAEAEKARGLVTSVGSGLPSNPVEDLHDYIGSAMSGSFETYRLAEHGGRRAGSLRIRRMNDPRGYGCVDRSDEDVNPFRLLPHEDLTQILDGSQKGFEIQDVGKHGNVCSVNVCVNDGDGGAGHPSNALHMWNMGGGSVYVPHDHPGFPYPYSAVRMSQRFSVRPRTGDVYVINGKFIHAVGRLPDSGQNGLHPQGNRTTLSWFMGKKDPKTVIRWT